MKKFLLLIPALALAGCVTTTQVDENISQVQSYTRAFCKYVPTVATVAKILSSSTVVDTASGIAAGICSALSTAPLADGPGKSGAYYRGVLIEGKRVR